MPLVRAEAAPSSTTTSTEPPTTTALPPTTATTRARVIKPPAAPAASRLAPVTAALTGGLAPYKGLGTWADVYDWSNSYTNNKPGMGVRDIDRMATDGVQTLYIQSA